jgi:hypothetical protein
LAPYNPAYLAGFKAQRYQVTLKEGFECAKGKMVPLIRYDVERDIGGDIQRVHAIATDYHAVTFKHILLPVWISSYRYQNKQYQVMVNAQTGEVLGDRPYSLWKITLTTCAGLATAAATILGLMIANGDLQIRFHPSPWPSSPPAPVRTPSVPPAPASAPTQLDLAFQDAIANASRAANITQSAQTRQDWEQVANLWVRAIELMKTVSTSSPNYGTAQQKVQEYQRNLNYARQQVANRE